MRFCCHDPNAVAACALRLHPPPGGTGTVAALCGIGGGVLIAPLLVEMKVLPQVTSAVTAMLVLIGSAVAVLKFALQVHTHAHVVLSYTHCHHVYTHLAMHRAIIGLSRSV